MKAHLYLLLLLSVVALSYTMNSQLRADDCGCCAHCGCHDGCHKVCRLVKEEKKVEKGILLGLHLPCPQASPPRHRCLLKGHVHHELVRERRL